MSADFDAQGLALAARTTALAVRRSLSVYNRPALAAWHAALADRANAPAKIVWLGDSITEGAQAAAYGQRWVDRALASLRSAYPTTGAAGGFNYLPAYVTPFMAQGQATTAINGGAQGLDPSWGLGGRNAVFQAAGRGVAYAITCTSFDLHYLRGLGAEFDVSIDGVVIDTIDASGPLGLERWNSGPLTPGAHTVNVIKSGAAGTLIHPGLTVYLGDETKGIQGHEGGHYGWTAGNVADAFGPGYYAALTAAGGLAPALVTVAVGTNDYLYQTPAATFRANLATIVANIRSVAPNASIALIGYARRGDLAAQPIGWQAYIDALYAVADADTGGLNGRGGVAVIDLSARLPDAAFTGAADALGLLDGDRVHYSTKGHALIGELVAGALRA